MRTFENCVVHWDKENGLFYVHDKDTNETILKISGLSKTISRFAETIDIKFMGQRTFTIGYL